MLETHQNLSPQTNTLSDPRVYFAAERTLLAWLRTGLTVIAIGFMISRFGLFLKLLAIQSHASTNPAQKSLSALLGIAFVLLGTLMIALSAMQHKRFVKSLSSNQLPQGYASRLVILMAVLLATLGLGLAVYLWKS
jgi:putative membrane protein